MKPSARLAQYLVDQMMDGVPQNLAPRSTPRARARQAAAWAMRRLCPDMTTGTIAHRIGWADHTTVLYAVARVEELRSADTFFQANTDALLEKARAELASVIDDLNRAYPAVRSEDVLRSVMNDVRRCSERLEKAVDRLNAYLERTQ